MGHGSAASSSLHISRAMTFNITASGVSIFIQTSVSSQHCPDKYASLHRMDSLEYFIHLEVVTSIISVVW